MINLLTLCNAIGLKETDDIFTEFLNEIGNYQITKYEFDETTYYSFYDKGIEIGVINQKINHIHIFMVDNAEYKANLSVKEINLKTLISSGGDEEGYLGYINKWYKYQFLKWVIRYEYDSNDSLVMISIYQDNI